MSLNERLAVASRYARAAVRDRGQTPRACIAPAPHRPEPATWPADRLTVSWLGHATVLLNLRGTTVLTDPVLERRIGLGRGFAKVGPRRLVQPALRKRELPKLDAVLLSHAHMDHTDLGTLRAIPAGTRVVVQTGNRDLVRRFRSVDELAWGETTRVDGVRIEAIETRHWGARMVTDRHRGWGGYLIQGNGLTILFGGDTAYTDVLTPLGARGPIDLAILPIGAYDPWVTSHASPEEAWRMFQALGARYLLPIHHSTFRLSREPMDEPVRRLLGAAGRERGRIVITEVGQTWTMPIDRGR